MSDHISFDADFTPLYDAAKWLRAYMGKAVRDVVNMTSAALRTHIVQDLFQSYSMIGPKNKGVLNSRSGELKRRVTSQPATVEGDDVRGYVGVGTKYGKVHFGKTGQVFHIVPKTAKMLAIPLPGAMDSNGTARGSPRDAAIFGQTFIARSKAGNLIIFGKLNYVRGKKAGQAKGALMPLFVLKNSVDVPVTVTTESLKAFAGPILGKGMADIRAGLESSTVGS